MVNIQIEVGWSRPSAKESGVWDAQEGLLLSECLNNNFPGYVLGEAVLLVSNRGEFILAFVRSADIIVLGIWDASLNKQAPYIMWFTPFRRTSTSLKDMCKS